MSKAIYPSKYTDRKVTDAQYLCDEIIERIARKEKKTLPYKYWNLPEWNKIYRRQIGEANKLLKQASCVAIMNFLRSKNGKYIFSLGLKKQIIDGVKNLSVVVVNKDEVPAEIQGLKEDFIIIDEHISIEENESVEPKANLWEKL